MRSNTVTMCSSQSIYSCWCKVQCHRMNRRKEVRDYDMIYPHRTSFITSYKESMTTKLVIQSILLLWCISHKHFFEWNTMLVVFKNKRNDRIFQYYITLHTSSLMSHPSNPEGLMNKITFKVQFTQLWCLLVRLSIGGLRFSVNEISGA